MFNINGSIDEFFKLPLKIIVALCIGSGIILFLPNNYIEKLYMHDFRENWGFVLGLFFVISLAIILCNIIVLTYNIIIKKKGSAVDIKNLIEAELKIIKLFYNDDLSKYMSSAVVSGVGSNSDVIESLINRKILKKQNDMELINSYTVSGNVWELTNEALKVLSKRMKTPTNKFGNIKNDRKRKTGN